MPFAAGGLFSVPRKGRDDAVFSHCGRALIGSVFLLPGWTTLLRIKGKGAATWRKAAEGIRVLRLPSGEFAEGKSGR